MAWSHGEHRLDTCAGPVDEVPSVRLCLYSSTQGCIPDPTRRWDDRLCGQPRRVRVDGVADARGGIAGRKTQRRTEGLDSALGVVRQLSAAHDELFGFRNSAINQTIDQSIKTINRNNRTVLRKNDGLDINMSSIIKMPVQRGRMDTLIQLGPRV